jgi:type IV pilus assembly protein PilF
MGSGVVRFNVALAVAVLVAVLSGCVSTTTGGFTATASPEEALEKRVQLARQYIGERNWDDAKRNLQMAQKIDANNADVHEAFALVYQSTGEHELALENFKRAIRLDRKCSRCRNNYAAYLYSRGDYAEAVEQLEEVVDDTLYPARSRAFINLGLARLKIDDAPGAEEAFERALAMERLNSIALLELAQLRFDAADWSGANKYYDTYKLAVRQQSARALWLGVRLARQSGDRDAEASYGLALRNLYPQSEEYRAYSND